MSNKILKGNIGQSFLSLPRDLGPHTVRQLRPYPDSMFALIGRLPTSLHVIIMGVADFRGLCLSQRTRTADAQGHESCSVLLTALTAEGNERSTAEEIERMINKALKPIRDDVKATRDDLGIVKDDLRNVKVDLGAVKV